MRKALRQWVVVAPPIATAAAGLRSILSLVPSTAMGTIPEDHMGRIVYLLDAVGRGVLAQSTIAFLCTVVLVVVTAWRLRGPRATRGVAVVTASTTLTNLSFLVLMFGAMRVLVVQIP